MLRPGPKSLLALIYTEPDTDRSVAAVDGVHRPDGFIMGFSARILPVSVDATTIPPLLKRARELLDLSTPPRGRTGCKDCRKLEGLVALISPRSGN